jgi:hypothetical protein
MSANVQTPCRQPPRDAFAKHAEPPKRNEPMGLRALSHRGRSRERPHCVMGTPHFRT